MTEAELQKIVYDVFVGAGLDLDAAAGMAQFFNKASELRTCATLKRLLDPLADLLPFACYRRELGLANESVSGIAKRLHCDRKAVRYWSQKIRARL